MLASTPYVFVIHATTPNVVTSTLKDYPASPLISVPAPHNRDSMLNTRWEDKCEENILFSLPLSSPFLFVFSKTKTWAFQLDVLCGKES